MRPKSSLRDKPTKKPSRASIVKTSANPTAGSANGTLSPVVGDVMTLAEAAAFLRAAPAEIKNMADAGRLPARRIGDEWRFLRSALCAWLSQCEAAPALSSKDRMLAAAGAWVDDETFPQFVQAMAENRKQMRGSKR